jgi:hypothetical protein
MQQLVILLVINCSSTYFGRLYAHHQEVRLRFTVYGVLFCCSCCDVGESGDKLCALCRVGCLTLQHHNSYNRTEHYRQWNAVWLPDNGRKDARNMLRNNWLPIKSLTVASSWSRLYLLIKDARSLEHKQTIFEILDFQLFPCCGCCILSFGWFFNVWILSADLSEHPVPFS